jgi:c-di-AMP phosphodiesterase-like protein
MGHRNPDFDAIGATVGIARLAMSVKKSSAGVRIVTDLDSHDFAACYETLSTLPEYKSIFIDSTAGLDLVRSDTLLIVVDVNNINIVESPDIAHSVANIAIIDHHRQFEVFNFKPVLNYIHPTASSTCELVSEMVEQSKYSDQLAKEEATILLAGIMLDTKNFTHGAGAQTFSAVHYLYERGAHTNVSRNFFNEDIEDLLTISDFGTKARIYRDIVAITWMNGTGNDIASNRISAAKAADKLLTLKGIDASFALVQTGDVVSISARSNEKINVQLVLEKLGGGGHFDMAGAQVSSSEIKEVSARLREAIDEYIDNVLDKS